MMNEGNRGFYTKSYPFGFIHCKPETELNREDDPEALEWLSHFDNIRVNGWDPLPRDWIDYLHTHGGRHRNTLFYENFQSVRFVVDKEHPEPSEAWKLRFLDDHRGDFVVVNPLRPPDCQEYVPGRWASHAYLGLRDYFINYGNSKAEELLVDFFYNVKRKEWGYDGIYFDLMGRRFTARGQIQDPADPDSFIGMMDQYEALAHTRDDPSKTYDENVVGFLERLRALNPDPAAWPIWGNQSFRSGDHETGVNPYYKVLSVDIAESVFTTWRPYAYKLGVRVDIDGTWYEDANIVETSVWPFQKGAEEMETMVRQARYAAEHYGNSVRGVLLNYIHPLYEPVPGGFRATVDREAIYYGYGASRAIGLCGYSWDFYGTYSNRTMLTWLDNLGGKKPQEPPRPGLTNLPLQGHFKWSKDPIYFLDLGDYADEGYREVDLGAGGKAVLRFFDKGFIIVNASDPPQDIVVDLSGDAHFKRQDQGVFGYYDHFPGRELPGETTQFEVPAMVRLLADAKANSARVYSYVDRKGQLIQE